MNGKYLQAFVCGVAVMAAAIAAPGFAAADTRWRIAVPRERIEWDVAAERRLPHADNLEMSGFKVSLILSYSVSPRRQALAA